MNHIKITLPDGKIVEGKKYVTTPLDIAKSISEELSRHIRVAFVDGEVWDINKPLEKDCTLSLQN